MAHSVPSCASVQGPQSVSSLTPWGRRGCDDQEQMPQLTSQGAVATLLCIPGLMPRLGIWVLEYLVSCSSNLRGLESPLEGQGF